MGWIAPGAACKSANTWSEKNLMTSTRAFVEVTPCVCVEPRVAIDARRKMAVSFDFQFACGLAAYCYRRGSVGEVSTFSPKHEKPELFAHLQIGADVLRDDLRDLRLKLFHERLVEVARSLPPRLAA